LNRLNKDNVFDVSMTNYKTNGSESGINATNSDKNNSIYLLESVTLKKGSTLNKGGSEIILK